MDLQEFKNPGVEYRAKTFWAWNGELDEKELLYQLNNFKKMGMGGAFFHSRTGLITPYLGDKWFSCINACADESAKLELEAWLYDEDRWPSGTAGGMVTQIPEYRMHYLRMNQIKPELFVYTDDVLAAFSIDLQENSAFTKKQRLVPGDIPSDTVVYFTVEEMECNGNYNGYTYVDTMNPKATQAFIDMTHEKYVQMCGSRVGNELKGIFTDEPHRGAVMCGFSTGGQHMTEVVPYTARLFEHFKNTYGYDLHDYLPELFLCKDGEKLHFVKWHYMELLQTLFETNYLQPIQQWCHEHHLQFTGHLLHENTLTNQACMVGSVIRAYEFMDIPGMDLLCQQEDYWVAVQLRSAARQLGKPWMLSELYGCTGWEFDFRSHKAVGDWQALFGANVRCPHLSWYTMKGEGKRDYPASISHQSAWCEEYRYIEDYFARLHMVLMEGTPLCETLVITPIESVWAVVHPGWSDESMATLDDDVKQIEDHYTALFHVLAGHRVDFDYGDEQLIAKYGSIEEMDGTVLLRVGDMTYSTVVIPRMLTIRSSTVQLLREFVQKGGHIVCTDSLPLYVDAEWSDEAWKLPVEYTTLDTVADILPTPYVRIDTIYSRLFAQSRKTEHGVYTVVMNMDRDKTYHEVTIQFPDTGLIEQWDLRTGEVVPLYYGDTITVDFAPNQEICLFVKEMQCEEPIHLLRNLPSCVSVKCSGPFAYERNEFNVCVLDMAEYQVNGQWYPKEDIILADRQIRRALGLPLRGGEMVQPWYAGFSEQPVMGNIKLRFSFHITTMPDTIYLAMETPEEFQIRINGQENAVCVTTQRWIDACFTVLEIAPQTCSAGMNYIELEAGMRNNLNLEALYLLGDFGVHLNGTEADITELPAVLMPGDITKQGFPFYSGGITYVVPAEPGAQKLSLDGYEAALLKGKGNGMERILYTAPYVLPISDLIENGVLKLQYIFTRRNTFGPLHYKPLRAEGYGPFTFTEEREELLLRDSYSLLPQGMISDISLIYSAEAQDGIENTTEKK